MDFCAKGFNGFWKKAKMKNGKKKKLQG